MVSQAGIATDSLLFLYSPEHLVMPQTAYQIDSLSLLREHLYPETALENRTFPCSDEHHRCFALVQYPAGR